MLFRRHQLYILTPILRPLIHANYLLEDLLKIYTFHKNHKLLLEITICFYVFKPTSHGSSKCVCACICVFWFLTWQFLLISLFASCKPKMKYLTALLSCMHFDITTVLNGFPMCSVEYILPYWQPHVYVKSIFLPLFYPGFFGFWVFVLFCLLFWLM